MEEFNFILNGIKLNLNLDLITSKVDQWSKYSKQLLGRLV